MTAQRLQLLGGTFPDTRLIVAPAARGAIAIQAEGADLQGAVLVPAGEGEALAGRMQRVFWRLGQAFRPTPAEHGRHNSEHPSAMRSRPGEDSGTDHRHRRAATGRCPARRRQGPYAFDRVGHAHRTTADAHADTAHRPERRLERQGRDGEHAAKLDIGSEDFGALLAGLRHGRTPGRRRRHDQVRRRMGGQPGGVQARQPRRQPAGGCARWPPAGDRTRCGPRARPAQHRAAAAAPDPRFPRLLLQGLRIQRDHRHACASAMARHAATNW